MRISALLLLLLVAASSGAWAVESDHVHADYALSCAPAPANPARHGLREPVGGPPPRSRSEAGGGAEAGDTASRSYGHLLFQDLFESLDKALRALSAAALDDADEDGLSAPSGAGHAGDASSGLPRLSTWIGGEARPAAGQRLKAPRSVAEIRNQGGFPVVPMTERGAYDADAPPLYSASHMHDSPWRASAAHGGPGTAARCACARARVLASVATGPGRARKQARRGRCAAAMAGHACARACTGDAFAPIPLTSVSGESPCSFPHHGQQRSRR